MTTGKWDTLGDFPKPQRQPRLRPSASGPKTVIFPFHSREFNKYLLNWIGFFYSMQCTLVSTTTAGGILGANSAVRFSIGVLRAPTRKVYSAEWDTPRAKFAAGVTSIPFFSLDILFSYILNVLQRVCSEWKFIKPSLGDHLPNTTVVKGGCKTSWEVFRWCHNCSAPPLHDLWRGVRWAHEKVWQMFTKWWAAPQKRRIH